MLTPEEELHQQWLAAMTGGGLGEDPLAAPPGVPSAPSLPPVPQIGAAPVPPPPELAPPAPNPMPGDDQALHDEWLAAMSAPAPQMPPEYEQPAVDAITAPDQPAPADAIPLAPAAPGPVGDATRQAPEALTVDEYVRLGPQARAKYDDAQDQQAQQVANAKLAEIQRTDAARADANERDYLDAQDRARKITDAALADSEAIANEKPAKFTDSLGNVLSGIAAIFLGQLGAPATGGKNMGMELLSRRMDQFAEDQQRELARRGANVDRRLNIAARLADAGYNAYQAKTVIRMAGLQRAREQLATEMQNYDPRGTTVRRLGSQLLQINAQMAKSAADLQRQAIDDETKKAALAKARLEVMEKERKLLGVEAGGGGVMLTPQQIRRDYGIEVDRAMKPGEVTQELERRQKAKSLGGNDAISRKQEADAQEAEAKAAAAKSGYAIANPETGVPLSNGDGQPFVVMDAEERKRLRSISGAAANIRKLADRMGELKKKYGGAIDSLGSEEAQELKSLASMIDFETFKAFDLGAPSEGDKALAEGARGGVNVTSFVKDATPGFQAFANSVEKKALGHLRAAGYTGKPLKFARAQELDAPKPKLTDELLARAMQAEYTLSKNLATTAANMNPSTQKANATYAADVNAIAAQAEFAPDEQAKRAARAALEQLAQKHPFEDGRELAAKALRALPGSGPTRER